MSEDVKDKIAQLEKELYAKEFKPEQVGDILRPKEAPKVPSSWDTAGEAASYLEEEARAERRHALMKKFLFGSIGFFVLASAIAGFVWWRGANIVSGENIRIETSAPPSIPGGTPFETKFVVANNNKVAVEEATLFIEYPAGFYLVSDKRALPRISKDLGSIAPGQVISESMNTLLYGEENTQKEVSVVLEYRMAGSNAKLKKSTTYAIKIASSPINVSVAMPKTAATGQYLDMTIDLTSNTQVSQEGILMDVVYPFGFTFKSADPAPTYGNSIWSFDTLAAQEKHTIKIHGIIEGQEGEEKITKISVGTKSANDERVIGVVYNMSAEPLSITRPFLGINVSIDGDSSLEHAVAVGRPVRVNVAWQSNSPTRLTDVVIEAVLKGTSLNRYSVMPSVGGFYRSSDNTIVWEKLMNPGLGIVEPNEKGTLGFTFSPIPLGLDADTFLKNPQISFEIRARARHAVGGGVSEDVSTFVSRAVKFETDIRLAARGLYFSGPFTNTGPLPPKAETETTYTIVWTVRNASNNVSNIAVKTTLPIYVKWLGKISPPGEDLSYNENISEVTWNVGRIPSGGTREAAFQVSFFPSISQIGQYPQLTGISSLTGTDDFSKTNLKDTKQPITTYITTDPRFSQNQASVIE